MDSSTCPGWLERNSLLAAYWRGVCLRLWRELKHGKHRVSVTVVAGDANGLVVAPNSNGEPTAQPACSGNLGNAIPAHRLAYFARAFDNHTISSICESDFGGSMEAAGAMLVESMRGSLQ